MLKFYIVCNFKIHKENPETVAVSGFFEVLDEKQIISWSAGLLSEKCTQACKPWNSVRFVARKIELKPRI